MKTKPTPKGNHERFEMHSNPQDIQQTVENNPLPKGDSLPISSQNQTSQLDSYSREIDKEESLDLLFDMKKLILLPLL